MKRVAIYTRVSTDEQTTENQLRDLKLVAEKNNWNIVSIFREEGVSGAKAMFQRPEGKMLKAAIEQGHVDVLASWSIDRLGRSLQDLLGTLSQLDSKGVGLYLHQQRLDTTTPSGRAMFQMLGVFAEFERSMIAERVKSGMQRAKQAGKHVGRPSLSEEKIRLVISLKEQGLGTKRIAKEAKVGIGTVLRTLGDSEAKRRLVGLL